MKRVVMVLLAGLALGCGDDSITALPMLPEIYSLALTPKAINIIVGGTQQLSATPKDTAGAPMASLPTTFTSSDTTKVRVSATGLVTGVALGSAEITAKVQSDGIAYRNSVAVTVTETPGTLANFVLEPELVTLGAGGYTWEPLSAIAYDSEGNVLTGLSQPLFVSTDVNKVFVQDGYLAAYSAGQAKIIATITVNGVTKADTTTVTVTYPQTANVFIGLNSTLGPGEFRAQAITIAPGGIVTWYNNTERRVDITFENPSAVEGGDIPFVESYESAERTFLTPGVYRYKSTAINASGTVTVK